MSNSTKEDEVVIPFHSKNWEDYPVGTYDKNTKSVEEAVSNTMEMVLRIVPSIKKSSKLLVYSSGSGFTSIYLSAHKGCKVECITNDEQAAEKIEKEVKDADLEDKITVSNKLFNKTLFHSNTFDMVWSIAENYQDDRALEVFREVARVLVPEGRYVMLHPFKSSQNQDNHYEELAIIDNFLKNAHLVDLEKVYVKKYKGDTIAHFKSLLDEDNIPKSQKEIITKNLKSAEVDDYVWALLVFQKRNT